MTAFHNESLPPKALEHQIAGESTTIKITTLLGNIPGTSSPTINNISKSTMPMTNLSTFSVPTTVLTSVPGTNSLTTINASTLSMTSLPTQSIPTRPTIITSNF